MFLVNDDLNLPTLGKQSVAVVRRYVADHAGVMFVRNFDQLGADTDSSSDRTRGQMIDAEVRTDALLMVFEKVDQDLPRRNFKMVGRGPGRVDAVDDEAFKGRTHVGGDDDGEFASDPWVEAGFHQKKRRNAETSKSRNATPEGPIGIANCRLPIADWVWRGQ